MQRESEEKCTEEYCRTPCSNDDCLRFPFRFSKMDEICSKCASRVSEGTYKCIDCGDITNDGSITYGYFDHMHRITNLVCSDCHNTKNFCCYDSCATKQYRASVLPLNGVLHDNDDDDIKELLETYSDLTDSDGNVYTEYRSMCIDCAERLMTGEAIDDCNSYPYTRGPF